MIFEIIPLKAVYDDLLDKVRSLLTDSFNASVTIVGVKDVPRWFKNVYRNQYDGALVLEWLASLRSSKDSIVLGIADVDAYVDGLNFIFGVSSYSSRVAVVFLERLRLGVAYQGLVERVMKEVMHEIGHVLGLRHCGNKLCVMHFSNTLYDTDRKEPRYCIRCYGELTKMGYSVSSRYLIMQQDLTGVAPTYHS